MRSIISPKFPLPMKTFNGRSLFSAAAGELCALVEDKDLSILSNWFRGYEKHSRSNGDKARIAVLSLRPGVGKASDGLALDVPLHGMLGSDLGVEAPVAIDTLDMRGQPLEEKR